MRKRKTHPKVVFFSIFLLILGIIALSSAVLIRVKHSQFQHSSILLIDIIHQTGENLIQDFKKSEHNQVPAIHNLFFSNISTLREQIIDYHLTIIAKSKIRTIFLSLFMSLSGLYYLFAFIGTFHLNLKSLARLNIAIMLWALSAITISFNFYITQTSLGALIDRLAILNNYIPVEARTSLIPPPKESCNPLFILMLLCNIIIYIIIPLWYINRTQIRKVLK